MSKVILPAGAEKNGLYEPHSTYEFGYYGETPIFLRYDSAGKPIYDNKMRGFWIHCREVFHRQCTDHNLKEFMFKTKHPGRVKAFLKSVQDQIKLKGLDRLTIHKTQHRDIVLVRMSEWWREDMRRSLLTILLKASKNYVIRKNNFWEAVEDNKYLGNQNALERFLKGHTTFTGRFGKGWKAALAKKTKTDVRKLLIKK